MKSRPEFQHLAHKNLERLGLADRVEFKLRDIVEGFDERNVDAVFLDLPNPQDYLLQVKEALKPGGLPWQYLTNHQSSLHAINCFTACKFCLYRSM